MFWTLALSAAFTLLALSPLVLPGGTPLEHLPPPLAGVEKIGRIVTSEVVAPVVREVIGDDAGEAEATPATPDAEEVPASGSGILGAAAGGDAAAGPTVVSPREDVAKPAPPRGRNDGEDIARPAAPDERSVTASGRGRALGHEKARGEGHAKENGEGHAKYHGDAGDPAAAPSAKPKPEKSGNGKANAKPETAPPKAGGQGKGKSDEAKAKPKKGESKAKGGGSGQGKGKHAGKGRG